MADTDSTSPAPEAPADPVVETPAAPAEPTPEPAPVAPAPAAEVTYRSLVGQGLYVYGVAQFEDGRFTTSDDGVIAALDACPDVERVA